MSMSNKELPSSYHSYGYFQKPEALCSHGKTWKASCDMKNMTSGLIYKHINRKALRIRYKETHRLVRTGSLSCLENKYLHAFGFKQRL